jgi:hypothetical protein
MEYNFDDWFISEGNNKIDFTGTELVVVGWIYLVYHKSQWQALILNFRVP